MAATLAFQGLCAQAFSEQEARTLAGESLAILRRLPVGKEMIYALQLLANLSHDVAEKSRIMQECLVVAREEQLGWWIPVCLTNLSQLALQRGDYAEAKSLLEEVLVLVQDNNDQVNFAQAFITLSQIAMLEGKYVEARSWAQKALAVAEDMGYASALWWSHSTIADNALLQGDYLAAQTHYEQGLAICQRLNEQRGCAFELNGLGRAACGLGNYSQARHLFYDALCVAKAVASRLASLDILSGIAELLSATGEPERGLCLTAYVADQPNLERITQIRNAGLLQLLKNDLALLEVGNALEQGKQLHFDETINTLLAELKETSPVAKPISRADPLTERELEVLRLVADGLSNYDIAVHLFLGVSTVKTHINRIFSKLQVKNRTQAVARARELRLL